MPVSAVKHFHDDLNRRVDVPEHPSHQGINSVREGKAKFLGKGNDGIVFDTNDGNVAKVTTSVPYNLAYFRPHGHAISDARKQAELNNQAISEGHDLLLPQEFIEHGEKGFTIMPKVQTGTDLSKEQILAYREKLQAFHDAGWRLNDDVQHGVDTEGNIRIFDTGALEKIEPGAAESSYGESQREHGDSLLRQHGHFDDVQAEEKLRTLLGKLRGPSSFVDAATQWQEMVDSGHDALPFLIDEAREALQPHQGNEMAAQFEELLASYESDEANRLLDERMVAAQQVFSDMVTDYEQYDDDELPHGESLDSFIDDRDLFSRFVPDLNERQLAALAFASYRSGSYLDDDTIHLAGFLVEPDELAYTAENGAVLREVLEIQNDAGLNAKGDELRPGEETAGGGKYEPEWITDQEADEFMRNQYPEGHSWGESGFLLNDGTLLDMSHGSGTRADDHRSIIPSEEAAARWGFTPDGQGDNGDPNSFSRWTILQQLLNRARAIRIDGDAGLINAQQPPTNEQWQSIAEWIEDFEPDYAAATLGETEWDVDNPTVGLLKRQFDAAAEGLSPGDEEWPGDEYDDELDQYAADESDLETDSSRDFAPRTGSQQELGFVGNYPTPDTPQTVIKPDDLEPYEHVEPEQPKTPAPNPESMKQLKTHYKNAMGEDATKTDSMKEVLLRNKDLVSRDLDPIDPRMIGFTSDQKNYLANLDQKEIERLHDEAHPKTDRIDAWENDEYYYHVTPTSNVKSILESGLKSNMPASTYIEGNEGSVYLSEKSAVKDFLREIGDAAHNDLIEHHKNQYLEHQRIAPEDREENWKLTFDKMTSKLTSLQKLADEIDRANQDDENGFDYVDSGHMQILRIPKSKIEGLAATDEMGDDLIEQPGSSFALSNLIKAKTRMANRAIGKIQQTKSKATSNFNDLKLDRISYKQRAESSNYLASRQIEFFDFAAANVLEYAARESEFRPHFVGDITSREGNVVKCSVHLVDPITDSNGIVTLGKKLISDGIEIDLVHDRQGDKRSVPLTLDEAKNEASKHFDFIYEVDSAPYTDPETVRRLVLENEENYQSRPDVREVQLLNNELENLAYTYTEFAKRTPTEYHLNLFAQGRTDDRMLDLAKRYRQSQIKGTEKLADEIESLVQNTSEKYTANEEFQNWKNQNQELYDHSLAQMGKSQINEMKAKVGGNPNFWAWAGNTKAVDDDGLPLIIFHGTPSGGFTGFDENKFDKRGHVYGSTDVTIASSYNGGYHDDITPTLANTVDDIRNSVANSPILEVSENDGLYYLHYKSDQGGSPYETNVIEASSEESFVVQWNKWLYSTPDGMRDGNQIRSRGVYPLVYKLQKPLIVEGYGERWHSVPFLDDEMQDFSAARLARVPQIAYFAQNKARQTIGNAVDNLISYVSGAYFENIDMRNSLIEELENDYTLQGNFQRICAAIDKVAELQEVDPYQIFIEVIALPSSLSTREFADVAEKMGMDGIIFRQIVDYGGDIELDDEGFDPGDVFVAFDPDQVKSVHNVGKFSRSDRSGRRSLLYQAAE